MNSRHIPPEVALRQLCPDWKLGRDEQDRPTIVCKIGRIVLLAPELMEWQVRSSGPLTARISALPFTTPGVHPDSGVAVQFPVANLADIAGLVSPVPRPVSHFKES